MAVKVDKPKKKKAEKGKNKKDEPKARYHLERGDRGKVADIFFGGHLVQFRCEAEHLLNVYEHGE